MKTQLAVALMALCLAARATPITLDIQGTLTSTRIENLPDQGIKPGDAFSATLTYDSTMPPDGRNVYTTPLDQYMCVTIDGLRFANVGPNWIDIWIQNNYSNTGEDRLLVELSHGFGPVTTPWGEPTVPNTSNLMSMFLSDPSGKALGLDNSLESVSNIDLAAWPIHEIILEAISLPNDLHSGYVITGDIQSITRIADAGGSLLLMALALPFLAAYRSCRK